MQLRPSSASSKRPYPQRGRPDKPPTARRECRLQSQSSHPPASVTRRQGQCRCGPSSTAPPARAKNSSREERPEQLDRQLRSGGHPPRRNDHRQITPKLLHRSTSSIVSSSTLPPVRGVRTTASSPVACPLTVTSNITEDTPPPRSSTEIKHSPTKPCCSANSKSPARGAVAPLWARA